MCKGSKRIGIYNYDDPFIKKYFSSGNDLTDCHFDGFSPHNNGHAEAIKRFLSTVLVAEGLKKPVLEEFRTWVWSPQKALDILSIPDPDNDSVKTFSLHPFGKTVGVGIHLFKRKTKQGKIDVLYERMPDGIDLELPLSLAIISDGSVWVWEYARKFGWSNVVSNHPYFILAVKMVSLLNTKYLDVEKVKAADRAQRKRWGLESPESKTTVNVVTWRKIARESTGNSKKEWDKSWWVRGHFRNQFYKREGVYRKIYISPFKKGNLNAPEYNKPTVYSVVR